MCHNVLEITNTKSHTCTDIFADQDLICGQATVASRLQKNTKTKSVVVEEMYEGKATC